MALAVTFRTIRWPRSRSSNTPSTSSTWCARAAISPSRRGAPGRPSEVAQPASADVSWPRSSLGRLRRHQFFFDATDWTRLVAELGELGVTKPVLPGIMPVTTITGIDRMKTMGAAVPPALVERLVAADERGGRVKFATKESAPPLRSVKSC